MKFLINTGASLLRPCVPRIHVAAKWTHVLNQDRCLVQSSLQKLSGQGVPPSDGFVSHVLERLIRSDSWPFTRYSKFTFFLVWRFLYIVSEARPPPLMMGGLFGSSWWLQGGGRAIITLWAVVRDFGRWLATNPVLSLYRRRIVSRGRMSEWYSKTSSFQSMIRIGYVIVRTWHSRVTCASPWGSPDRGARHVSLFWGVLAELLRIAKRATCHQGEGSLHSWHLLVGAWRTIVFQSSLVSPSLFPCDANVHIL